MSYYYRLLFSLTGIVLFLAACSTQSQTTDNSTSDENKAVSLKLQLNEATGTISVLRETGGQPIVTQQAKPDFRPYLHPIEAPDGKGPVTEFSPGHHKHQTGLYWGFTRVNGRDYFHHPEGDYWKRVSLNVIVSEGTEVKWQTVYDMLDENGNAILQESQNWSMQEEDGRFFLNLEWEGLAKTDITIGEYDYGGLFLRMPWREGINGRVINAAREKNERAEGKRAMWVDVGMQLEGRDNLAHVAIFDHPQNAGFPQTWRVDGQLGVGPVRARMGDWKIENGQVEIIKHQLVVYTEDLTDVAITDIWQNYTGDHGMYSTASLWGIAQREGRESRFLTPEEAVNEMSIMDGYKVNAWASEPMITQPMAFCWDDKGRLWIAENRDYETRGTGFSNSGDSRILILEDTDRDGVADSRKVFLEGIPFPAGIAVGFDGLFLGAPPNLLFVPDKNGDDKAEKEDIKVLLTGWGIRDRHETINSLHWGPDGWLYGCEGFATPSKIRKPKGKGRIYRHKEPFPEDLLEAEGVDINGGIWRYHPTKDRFEVVAHGFSNPWGIDYDANGQMFITACVIPHMFHIIPGGIYHRQGGSHFNPYVYSDIRTIVDHSHRSAHGGARIYQSDAFPAEQKGRLFMANIHEHAVLSDILTPKGSGFVASHADDFLLANNGHWIGFSMEIGPEGGLYVLDWHDGDICGKEVLHKETGRIYRMLPEQSQAKDFSGRYDDLKQMSDLQLAELQSSESDWHTRRARVVLQARAAKGGIQTNAVDRLKQLFAGNQQSIRLKAMWALHVTGSFSENDLLNILKHKDPYVRGWAIQMLCEDQNPSEAVLATFEEMARKDASPVVRLYLAASLQRMEMADRWTIAESLIAHAEDVEDHNIPKMIWFGIEPLFENHAEKALKMVAASRIPILSEWGARRMVDGDQMPVLVKALNENPSNLASMLLGMQSSMQGRTDVDAPAGWAATYKRLQSNKSVAELAMSIAQQFGDAEAAQSYMQRLKNTSASVEDKKEAINGLAAIGWKQLPDELPGLLENPDLRMEAIRAMAAYENRSLAEALLKHFHHFDDEAKREAMQTLASRPTYGYLLTRALDEGEIEKREVPVYLARQLRRVVGNGFVEVWGPIDQVHGDKQLAYARYRNMLSTDAIKAADMASGKTLFTRTCGACHQMNGEGGKVGPDITGSNRTNLDYLLSNMLDPSEDIQDDYKMVTVTTRDGRTYVGNIIAENDRQITLRMVGQEALPINKSDIQSREVSDASLMPEGLLQTLTEQEVVDLVAYLQGA